MTNTEKTLLIIAIFFSWGYGFLIRMIFGNSYELEATLGLVIGGLLLWLTPFALLSLFFSELRFPLIAFILGSLGFFLIVQEVPLVLGLLLLVLGFTYWFLRVKHDRESNPGFSVLKSIKGIGLFFTILAAFGALLYFYSPFISKAELEPKVPERFFEVIYYPLSGALFSQLNVDPRLQAQSPEVLKPQIYAVVNAALEELATKYQRYIPFAFTAGAFFFLRAVFIPLKYILLAFVYILVQLFLKAGWLHREKVEVEREMVKF